jgi:hypothetical protein
MRSDLKGQEIRALQRLLTVDGLRNLGTKNNLMSSAAETRPV